jgi:hypothetical protein
MFETTGHDARGYDNVIMHPPTWLVHHEPAEWPPNLGFPTTGLSPRAVPGKNADTAGIRHTLLMTTDRAFHNVDPSLRYLRHGKPLATTGQSASTQLSQQCCDKLVIGKLLGELHRTP